MITYDAQGNLTQTAIAEESIDALVLAGSMAISAAGTTGVGLSGSGASAKNKIATWVKAFIAGDGSTGIVADRVTLTAYDISGITADVAAASLAASFAGTTGASLSVGVAIAQNEIDNEVDAYILDADQVTTTTGDITIEARTLSADLDAADYTTESGTQLLKIGDTVRLADDYANGGEMLHITSMCSKSARTRLKQW